MTMFADSTMHRPCSMPAASSCTSITASCHLTYRNAVAVFRHHASANFGDHAENLWHMLFVVHFCCSGSMLPHRRPVSIETCSGTASCAAPTAQQLELFRRTSAGGSVPAEHAVKGRNHSGCGCSYHARVVTTVGRWTAAVLRQYTDKPLPSMTWRTAAAVAPTCASGTSNSSSSWICASRRAAGAPASRGIHIFPEQSRGWASGTCPSHLHAVAATLLDMRDAYVIGML